jgi:hypothetical protein
MAGFPNEWSNFQNEWYGNCWFHVAFSGQKSALNNQATSALTQIIHWSVGRASARLVGINPDLQPLDFVTPQNLMDYPSLKYVCRQGWKRYCFCVMIHRNLLSRLLEGNYRVICLFSALLSAET